jgi:3-oxoacyl-[acyl-carrier-protein] synthase III
MRRSGNICEPAIAAMIAGDLGMNDVVQSDSIKKTLAFDVYNSSIGFLNACHAATQMIRAGNFKTAMIIASEVEINAKLFPDRPTGVHDAASAIILDRSADDRTGFGQFVFKYYTEYLEDRRMYGIYVDGKPCCFVEVDPQLYDHYLECIPSMVDELLDLEGLDKSQIAVVLPPQFSSAFNAKLGELLGVGKDRVVDLPHGELDLYGSSVPYGLQHVRDKGLIKAGDIGLLINVGAGIQVGCATYRF